MCESNTYESNMCENNICKSNTVLLDKLCKDYSFFGKLSFIYGLIFTFCLYKNLSGITFPICVAATIIISIQMMKKLGINLKKDSFPYIAGMLLLGISTPLTASFFIHFFNLIGIILLYFAFMIHQFYHDYEWNFTVYVKRFFVLIGTFFQCIPSSYRHGAIHLNKGKKQKKNNTLFAVIIGIFIAIGILGIILPLLVKSDAVFSNLFGELLKGINFGSSFWILIMILVGFNISYSFIAALSKKNFSEEKKRRMKYYNPVTGITFTGIVSIIYLIYCVIQILYLFIGIQTGLPENMTYAEYARGGFWELLYISIINFIMVLLCMYMFSENLMLKIILTIISSCTFIMIFSAAYRMFLYIQVYHLSFLRILVLWFLIVIAFIMAGTIVSIYKKKFPLFHYIMAIVSVLYIGLSFSKPDIIVAKYNISHIENMNEEDVYYLMYNLSLDAAPYIEEIDPDNLGCDSEYLKQDMLYYFEQILSENKDISSRKANYSKIKAKNAADTFICNFPSQN